MKWNYSTGKLYLQSFDCVTAYETDIVYLVIVPIQKMDDVIVNEMGLLNREINCTCTKNGYC